MKICDFMPCELPAEVIAQFPEQSLAYLCMSHGQLVAQPAQWTLGEPEPIR